MGKADVGPYGLFLNTWMLQEKPSALSREHPALQPRSFQIFLFFLWVIFPPGSGSKSGFGFWISIYWPDWIKSPKHWLMWVLSCHASFILQNAVPGYSEVKAPTTPLPTELGPVNMAKSRSLSFSYGLFLNTWMRIFMAASLGRRPPHHPTPSQTLPR